MIGKIKKFIDSFKTKYTQEVSIDESEQCYVYKCYENGKYTHTCKIGYFTEKQIKNFVEINECLMSNKNGKN